jgi:NAD(P)-dependent dehydrogenase (short-subunit alcohol dehydrogenase family)
VAGADAARFSLAGKTALITGATRGLGLAMALGFADAGADVVVSSRKFDACEQVANLLRARGRRALPVSAHVGRWETLPGLVDRAYEHFGKIDVLVNNAGSSPLYDSLVELPEALFDSVINLNLKAPFRLGVLVGSRMVSDGGGSIINISSAATRRPDPAALPYAAAKSALDTVTVGLAQAFAPTVRVNGIRPGSFATDVSAHWTGEDTARYADRVVMNRIAEPTEIVGTAIYLASDASSFTTATTIDVDGGLR